MDFPPLTSKRLQAPLVETYSLDCSCEFVCGFFDEV